MSDALIEYSHQRAGLIPRARSPGTTTLARARDAKVVDRGEGQKRRDGDVDAQVEQLGRATVAARARGTGHEGEVDGQ